MTGCWRVPVALMCLLACTPAAGRMALFDQLSPERLVSGCGGFGAPASEMLPDVGWCG